MWKIKIHRLVIEEDLEKINKKNRTIILKTIYKKLIVAPEKYGSPLRNPLEGYSKLEISHYRVIYRIKRSTIRVLVLKAGMRRDAEVYKEMLQRMKKI